MKIAIIQYDNNEYFIDQKSNDFEVTKLNNNELRTLSISEQYSLFKEIFDSKLEYKTNYNGYDIYIDEVSNKRFFKDGIEDYQLFFIDNGENAMLHEEAEENKESMIKRYKIINKVGKSAIITSSIILVSYLSALSYKTFIYKQDDYNPITELKLNVANYHLEANDVINLILNSKINLSEEQKKYLANENFIKTILSYSSNCHNYITEQKLKEMKITYYNDYEKNTKDSNGEYNQLYNIISLRDDSEYIFNNAAAHEFIHLMQEVNEYSYITEASATMLAHEFYGVPNNSYVEEVYRLKLLMEMIGPKTIMECNFKGDTTSFEEKIHQYLSKKEASELLELFTRSPAHNTNCEETNEKIDNLLRIMHNNIYNKDIEDNSELTLLKNDNLYNDRYYFNASDEKINKKFIYFKEDSKIKQIDKEEIKEYICGGFEEISKEQYEAEKNDENSNIDIKLTDKNGKSLHIPLFTSIDKNNSEETLNDLLNTNFYDSYSYVKYVERNYNTYEEAIKEVSENDKEIVKIIPKDLDDYPIDVLKNANGDYCYREYTKISSIPEKFPEQFNNTNKVEQLFESNNNENNLTHTR